MCWWNINNNISFHYRLFPKKLTSQIFSKYPKNPILGPFLAFLLKLGPKTNFPGIRALSVFQYLNYLPLCQKSEKPKKPFLRRLLEGHTKNQFISLISLWDAVNFRVLRLTEKSYNLIGQERLGPSLIKKLNDINQCLTDPANWCLTDFSLILTDTISHTLHIQS